jgi:CubicO group peptidase (beta-lactamase class C family)
MGELLPELKSPQVLEGLSRMASRSCASEAITLRHLLTHTARFTYDLNADTARYAKLAGLPGSLRARMRR